MAELKVGIVGYGQFGRFLHRAWGPVDPGTFPAERGRFALGESKVEVYRECLRALPANLEAPAAGEEPLAVTLEDAAAALQIALRATETAGARGDPGTIKGMAP